MTQQGSSKEDPLGACNEMKEALPTLRPLRTPKHWALVWHVEEALGLCPKGLKSVRDLASGFGNKADAKDSPKTDHFMGLLPGVDNNYSSCPKYGFLSPINLIPYLSFSILKKQHRELTR